MSKKGTSFQTGGGGTNFEQSVQTAFLINLIVRGIAPCIPVTNHVVRIGFQTPDETDDLVIITKSQHREHKILAQIKNNLRFSPNDDTFKKVIKDFWMDFNKSSFNKSDDRLVIIKSNLTKDDYNHVKSMLNWANAKSSSSDYMAQINETKAKTDKLVIFKNILKEVNDGVELSDEELWEFLRCVDLIAYDFLNEGSTSKTNFLNLIKRSKASTTNLSENEIWNSAHSYVSKLNPNGGTVTIESIKNEAVFKYFDHEKLSPLRQSIDKLKTDGLTILKPFKNTIGDVHLDRQKDYQKIIDSVNDAQFTIVTGKPGVGKSAAVKDVLDTEYPNASTFVFRADQFNEPSIANVFSKQGVNDSIQDIFSCIGLIPEKIIIIDSLEKLLEGDPENAFRQLIEIVKDFPDVKIIATARRYCINLICLKFGLNVKEIGLVEVEPLSNADINIVCESYPKLIDVVANNKLRKLLESPKYLDFAVTAIDTIEDDLNNITLSKFKGKLWNVIVKNVSKPTNGLPAKREEAFLKIAVDRAKAMKLFVKPIGVDHEAVNHLEHDEVLFQDGENGRYSPTHDILEDWALVKYVSNKYEEFPTPEKFFSELGNEPAIRRAFRLWVEDNLTSDSHINNLINSTLKNPDIEKYWADELMVAIFKSEDCSSFFDKFKDDLLENNAIILRRCIHLIRTACKENNIFKEYTFLAPTGSGWKESLAFIKNNLSELQELRPLICRLLFDWEYRFFTHYAVTNDEMLDAKKIVISFIKQIEDGGEFWRERLAKYGWQGGVEMNTTEAKLISLLYRFADISQSEIIHLINNALEFDDDNKDWKLRSFYKIVLNKCLSGIGTQNLTKELPNLVIKVAWSVWKLKTTKENVLSPFGRRSGLSDEDCWGVINSQSFYPSGIFRTPVYNLMQYHPAVGIRFITEFLNYVIEFHVNSSCDFKREIISIELELIDGITVKKWATWDFWGAYRGISVTHNLIESLLMSLEKYLLELAQVSTEKSKNILDYVSHYLLKNSNNVATTAVIASVAMAYPKEITKNILPIFSVGEFYYWDSARARQESSALSPIDASFLNAHENRHKLNQLPHRKKYWDGLKSFIIDYQLTIRKFNNEIHKIFDKMKSNLENDIIDKKILVEIDIRNREAKKNESHPGYIALEIKYPKEISDFIDSNKPHIEAQNTSVNYWSIIHKAFEGEEPMTFEVWKECFSHYSTSSINVIYDIPVTLSVLGLRDFNDNLNFEQKQWCVEMISYIVDMIAQSAKDTDFSSPRTYNISEKDIALSSFHLLLKNTEDEEGKHSIILLLIYVLSTQLHHTETKILKYVSTVLLPLYPLEAKKIWAGLIEFAEFKKQTPSYRGYDSEELQTYKLKEEQFLSEIDFKNTVPIESINLENYESSLIITNAFLIIPFNTKDEILRDFIKHFVSLIVEKLLASKDYSSSDYHIKFLAKEHLASLLLHNDFEFSSQVLDILLVSIYADDSGSNAKKHVFEFISEMMKRMIYQLDTVRDSEDESFEAELISNFWKIWPYIYLKNKSHGDIYFASILLLGIEWNSKFNEWKPLEEGKDFYYEMVKELGCISPVSIIKLFSTVGDKVFLPHGISWLVAILKENPHQQKVLPSESSERLVKRLFYNHISEIKNSQQLINDFIWLLDKMVDLGSSEAYLFRENVITYKKGFTKVS